MEEKLEIVSVDGRLAIGQHRFRWSQVASVQPAVEAGGGVVAVNVTLLSGKTTTIPGVAGDDYALIVQAFEAECEREHKRLHGASPVQAKAAHQPVGSPRRSQPGGGRP
jgi:hypothetical protein